MTTEVASQIGTYRIDPATSAFTVKAFAEGLFSAFGHDPLIGVKEFAGEARFVPATFENASVKLVVKTASLVVVSDVKEKDRQEIERMMRLEVLETEKYPEIVFESSSVSLSRIVEGRYRSRVIGNLTLHGVTQNNLWISGEVWATNDGLRVKGECPIKQTDYKIKLVSVAGGTLKIKNEVKCSFDLSMRRAE